jgi:hypothetical protein
VINGQNNGCDNFTFISFAGPREIDGSGRGSAASGRDSSSSSLWCACSCWWEGGELTVGSICCDAGEFERAFPSRLKEVNAQEKVGHGRGIVDWKD